MAESYRNGQKTLGKGEIAGFKQISPFPTVFSKGLLRRQKVSLCENGLNGEFLVKD